METGGHDTTIALSAIRMVFVLAVSAVVMLTDWRGAGRKPGARYIKAGFALLSMAVVLDFASLFPARLAAWGVWQPEIWAFLEIVVGSLGGAFFLFIGF